MAVKWKPRLMTHYEGGNFVPDVAVQVYGEDEEKDKYHEDEDEDRSTRLKKTES